MPQSEFDPAFYGATDSLEGRIPSSAGFRETVERVAAGLATRLGREDDLLRRIGERFTRDSLRQLAESASILSRLRDRYRIGVVSNFYGNLQAVLDEAGLSPSISVAVDSTLAGCKKPDPRIFPGGARRPRAPRPRKRSSWATRSGATWPARAGWECVTCGCAPRARPRTADPAARRTP